MNETPAFRSKRLLIACDWFAPGYRAGGPITSCVNLNRLLRGSCLQAVVTGSKDLGDIDNYSGVNINRWTIASDDTNVFYGSNKLHLKGVLFSAACKFQPQAVYLNSMFSWKTCLLPVLFQRQLGDARIVLAPRGMLKPSALQHRSLRKQLWLGTMRKLGLDRRIIFHATSQAEQTEIEMIFGKQAKTVVLPNVPRTPVAELPFVEKKSNHLRLAFVGRCHPIKNLLLVLEMLKNQNFDCQFEIIGPQEDGEYVGKCEAVLRELPNNIEVKIHGALPTETAMQVVSQCHAMILPTEGENFGHAIFEALGAGVPVIISDQTQWRNLTAQMAGWDLPLNQSEQFAQALQIAAGWNQDQWQAYRTGAHQLATRFFAEHNFCNRYMKLFFSDDPLSA
jgi:glycosyltransferase involved in cell wall biosynthesis